MPILKIVNESYFNEDAMVNVIDYICRGGCIGGLGVNPECAALQMSLVKCLWYKEKGRQIRHFILSFSNTESVDHNALMAYGYATAYYYFEKGFQVLFGIHCNTLYPHLHFAVNTVNFRDGYMYNEGWGDASALRAHIEGLMPQWRVELVIEKSYSWSRKIR